MGRIRVTPKIAIPDEEINEQFIRSAGPGGENVNKVASAVKLRWNVKKSRALTPEVRDRLITLAGRRCTVAGDIVIHAQRSRSQEQNREDALNRLIGLVVRAAVPPKQRQTSAPNRGQKEQRLQEKHLQSRVKHVRGRVRLAGDVEDAE